MDLKTLVNVMKKYKKVLFSFFFAGVVLGVGFNYLPEKYISTGSFYITRKSEGKDTEYFTYEGYYGQQSAASYTNTAIALLKTDDILKKSLTEMNILLSEQNLRKYEKSISAKKTGSQLITLAVSRKTKEESLKLWNSLAKTFVETNDYIQNQGDPNIKIVQISAEPLVKTQYKSNIIFGIVGGILGTCIGAVFVSLKEYFK